MLESISFEVTRYPFISLFEEEQGFKTSLNIIGEVMNVPMCALKSILRATGYDEVEPGSICIDEKMLSIFADAYIRKMKNYFLGSVRNIENLSYEEFTDLNEFYNTFKKQDIKFVRRAEWSQIDTELIRTAFMDKIKKLTPQKKTFAEIIFGKMMGTFHDLEFELHHILRNDVVEQVLIKTKDDVLVRISRSLLYHAKRKINKLIHCISDFLRQLFVSARYHIFVGDDKNPNRFLKTTYNKSLLIVPIGYFLNVSDGYIKDIRYGKNHKKYQIKQFAR